MDESEWRTGQVFEKHGVWLCVSPLLATNFSERWIWCKCWHLGRFIAAIFIDFFVKKMALSYYLCNRTVHGKFPFPSSGCTLCWILARIRKNSHLSLFFYKFYMVFVLSMTWTNVISRLGLMSGDVFFIFAGCGFCQ